MKKIVDLERGTWFTLGNERFMKMDTFRRGNQTYLAVNLADGSPAFLARASTRDTHDYENMEVRVIDRSF